MSVSAAQASAFFTEVVASKEVWTIRDDHGFPTVTNDSSETVMPFCSKLKRALAIIDRVRAYQHFRVECLPLDVFIGNWLPGLETDGLCVGVNWSGERATGYDMKPHEVLNRLKFADDSNR